VDFDLRVRIKGDEEVQRALRQLPGNAERELRRAAVDLSRQLANFVRAAGRADSRQSARASRSVRAATDGLNPAVVAGPHPLLFGSEFGAWDRFGWYARRRYGRSRRRQFRAHLGAGSYWFFRASEQADPLIQRELEDAEARILRAWSA
jgi:hypothetical protein